MALAKEAHITERVSFDVSKGEATMKEKRR
jgi:hypothetical protein